VTVSLASLCTRRRDSGVIIGPSRSLLVAQAIAASATHGSATARTGAVLDVVPDEEAVPAPLFGGGRERGQDPRVGELVKRPDVDALMHAGDLSC
jgi:hypothetical protein